MEYSLVKTGSIEEIILEFISYTRGGFIFDKELEAKQTPDIANIADKLRSYKGDQIIVIGVLFYASYYNKYIIGPTSAFTDISWDLACARESSLESQTFWK
jgi:hypothetical protein